MFTRVRATWMRLQVTTYAISKQLWNRFKASTFSLRNVVSLKKTVYHTTNQTYLQGKSAELPLRWNFSFTCLTTRPQTVRKWRVCPLTKQLPPTLDSSERASCPASWAKEQKWSLCLTTILDQETQNTTPMTCWKTKRQPRLTPKVKRKQLGPQRLRLLRGKGRNQIVVKLFHFSLTS